MGLGKDHQPKRMGLPCYVRRATRHFWLSTSLLIVALSRATSREQKGVSITEGVLMVPALSFPGPRLVSFEACLRHGLHWAGNKHITIRTVYCVGFRMDK
jgi:hypothetical protein